MSELRILVVDDDLEWTPDFLDDLLTVTPEQLTGRSFDEFPKPKHATNQVEASAAVAELRYDLIFLDLDYPEEEGGTLVAETGGEFQGMRWLRELRRLQPDAAIVILTAYAHSDDLRDAVNALRDWRADDYVPKTVPFEQVVWRIQVAYRNARSLKNLTLLQEEYRGLLRSHIARTYAEDIGTFLNRTKASLFHLAQCLESGDPGLAETAPDKIRAEFHALEVEFRKLTELLYVGSDRTRQIDVAEALRQVIRLYDMRLEDASVVVEGLKELEGCELNTFEGDLKVAFHEIVANAIDSLERSSTPPVERRLKLAVEQAHERVVVRVVDNGDGLPEVAEHHVWEPGWTTKDRKRHQGMGLYIARRMMDSIGSKLEVKNRPEGGTEAKFSLRDLG